MKQTARDSGTDGAFWRILETLMTEDGRTDGGTTRRASSRSMPFWHVGETRKRSRGPAKPSDFLDFLAEAPEHESPEPERPALPRITPEDVRAELAIEARHDLSDLGRIRKRFAAANHPDRTTPDRRGWAEERMKLANSIIDREIEQRRGRRRVRT